MMMNNEPEWSDELPDDEQFVDEKSKSQRKREMHALQAMGAQLVGLSPALTAQLQLPEKLLDAIEQCRRITAHGGRVRQLQFIGRLMREIDVTPIETALARLQQHARLQNARFHHVEYWRDRLLEEGDAAINALLGDYPDFDRQQLRTLLRKARKEQDEQKPPAAARELFKLLRAHLPAVDDSAPVIGPVTADDDDDRDDEG